MINEKLHVLFHDLTGPIGSIDTLSQICVAYITKFNLDKLEGKFINEITKTFENVLSYHSVIIEKLNPTADALIEIDERDMAVYLKDNINREVEKIKDIGVSSELSYNRLLESNTKENLTAFTKEISGFNSICDSLTRIIKDCKDKLTAMGKY